MSLFNPTPEKTPLFETREFCKPILSKTEKVLALKQAYAEEKANLLEEQKQIALQLDSFLSQLNTVAGQEFKESSHTSTQIVVTNDYHTFFTIEIEKLENEFSYSVSIGNEILCSGLPILHCIKAIKNFIR